MKKIGLLVLCLLPIILMGQLDPIQNAVDRIQPVYAIVDFQNEDGEWGKRQILKTNKEAIEALELDENLILSETEEIEIDQMAPVWVKEKAKRCCFPNSDGVCLIWKMKMLHIDYTDQILHYKPKAASDSSIKLYPNPSMDFIEIETKNVVIEEMMLFDMEMQLQRQFPVETSTIDLTTLTAGYYFLQVFPKNQPPQILKFEKAN